MFLLGASRPNRNGCASKVNTALARGLFFGFKALAEKHTIDSGLVTNSFLSI